ncbi:MAG: aspartate kinase [Candidatus Binatia bacterium]|nr:aspartate kinase [Candidatus Binatia bacterium]
MKPLVVQKYGGTSVGSIERIQDVARRVAATVDAGNRVIAVVSAMSGETNRLLELAGGICKEPQVRETDVVIASGEQVSAALLSIALNHRGTRARSFLGHQIRIHTDADHGRARIRSIDGDNLCGFLDEGGAAIVAGFQGVNEAGDITTLGRGGSDTTAVAIAAATSADACEIYTDVDGVYTTDPRVVPEARKLERVSYEEMLELASLGAKVLQIRSVEFAKRYGVRVHVRSSFNEETGTWVVPEESNMEDVLVSGVAFDRNQAKITLPHVPDQPGLAAHIFSPIAEQGIVVDMIIQNVSADGTTDMTFTVPRNDVEKALQIVRAVSTEVGAGEPLTEGDIAKVSVVGLGMRSHAGVAARIFEILGAEGINIHMISTSEIKVSVVIDSKYVELATRVLHDRLVGDGKVAS